MSNHGIWLLARGKELFLSFEDFPWFRRASIGDVTAVCEIKPGHFRWPKLDVDLDIKSIEDPDKYPLIAR